MTTVPEKADIAAALRHAGARFALIHGSRATGESARPDSDLDVAAWWAGEPPQSWELNLPAGVDLVVLNRAPLWLAGRIALEGRLLFDDDPAARVAWQADTRRIWLDERPQILQSQREFRQAVAERGR
ncbi:MAG TPA: nucleotidyltransferase domain-containing protein [Mycobacterium sp.]|nr:nucleotidyltransferase domain-containing protein [Mycobacterium sp.]HUH70102.1 nucleotidyltransferase domain-containing protein [Mycobacterium sp.]